MIRRIGSTIKNTKCYIKIYCGKYKLFYFLHSIYPKFKHRVVQPDTAICIEGFPRSGNTFCYHAFRLFNPNIKIAHHIHSPAQLYWAKKYHVPCLIMIRNPLDSIASVIVVDGKLSINVAIKYYIYYYKELLKYIWNENLIITDIKMINNDFDKLVEFINLKYNRTFSYDTLGMESINQIKRNAIESNVGPRNLIPVPTNEKQNEKDKIVSSIQSDNLYDEALALYNKVLTKKQKL